MKKINLKSKDNLYDINIEYLEPKDISNINDDIASYVGRSAYILNSYIVSYISDLSNTTNETINYIQEDYTYKFDLMDRKLYDMSINLRNTLTYELDTTYTDMMIINDVKELDERFSYAIRTSNNILNTYNSDINSKLAVLTYYISNHINEYENLPTENYWQNYH